MGKKKNKPAAETDAFGDFLNPDGQGWSAINNAVSGAPDAAMSPEAREAYEQNQQREFELNAAIHRTFTKGDGILVWEFWRELATECQRFDVVNETDPALAAAKGFFREGQAAMYFEFKRRMALAMLGPPAARE